MAKSELYGRPHKLTTTFISLKTKLAIRTEKAERNDKNDYKNQVFAAKTILNYLGTGNKKFIRCFVLCVRDNKQACRFPFRVTVGRILSHH